MLARGSADKPRDQVGPYPGQLPKAVLYSKPLLGSASLSEPQCTALGCPPRSDDNRPVKCAPTARSWRADGIGMMINKARSGSL